MTNWSGIGYECQKDIRESVDVERVEHVQQRIDQVIAELEALKPEAQKRIEHIRKHIQKKYHIALWKTKGTYRDTDLINGDYVSGNINTEITGSHYTVVVHEYIFDTSLIGLQKKIGHEAETITVPVIQVPGHNSYNYQLSKQFSWKKKELAIQYANGLCAKFGVPALTEKSDKRFTDGFFMSSAPENSPSAVWYAKQ